ncbi:MAG: hypothetical protein A2W91_13640 [Bacteroidetes bacterium GWF2_38_335]|nr:MAG: hypothetical protein A2W91_13640 [Bacteroidetes bacterium GWF2_38_335]OFY77292.1 MAG: hypothetical protein A2281_15305 [Bacteroidetes bacterium RIFOXYA12_FULL_38_20]HBS85703.1 hypothetical protein [Bacteroidales bacterium]
MKIFEVLSLLEGSITIIAIIVGAFWTYRKFVRQRERHPKIQFDIDINFLTIQDDNIIFEICLMIENKGVVRHQIDANSLSVNLRYLLDNDKIEHGTADYNYQTKFTNFSPATNLDFNEKRLLIPKKWQNTFIDPGVIQKYSYVTHLPVKASCILVKSKFNYSDKDSDFHGAQKAFSTLDFKLKCNNMVNITS